MADDSTLAALGERLVAQVVEFGIRGVGPLSTAVQTAEEHLITAGGDREEAVQRLIATHVRLAAATGFVTGLGGFITMPISLPANVLGFYLVATRMTAAIASLRGYDIKQQQIRSAVLLTLVGADADDLLAEDVAALPGEADVFRHAVRRGLLLERVAQDAVADDQDVKVRTLADEVGDHL